MTVRTVAVLLTCVLAVLTAALLGLGAACLALHEGATRPMATVRAARAFACTLTVLAAVTAALASVLR